MSFENCVGSIKLYEELDKKGNVDKRWLNVRNAKEIAKIDLKSGDMLDIKGLGTLEILDVDITIIYESGNEYTHVYMSAFLKFSDRYTAIS